MKAENTAGAVFLIPIIRKACQFPSGFIGEADLIFSLDPLKGAACIAAGLCFHHSDILALIVSFCLHNPHRDSFYEQSIIYWPSTGGEFPYSYP